MHTLQLQQSKKKKKKSGRPRPGGGEGGFFPKQTRPRNGHRPRIQASTTPPVHFCHEPPPLWPPLSRRRLRRRCLVSLASPLSRRRGPFPQPRPRLKSPRGATLASPARLCRREPALPSHHCSGLATASSRPGLEPPLPLASVEPPPPSRPGLVPAPPWPQQAAPDERPRLRLESPPCDLPLRPQAASTPAASATGCHAFASGARLAESPR